MSKLCTCIAVLAIVAISGLAESERLTNPEYSAWKDFKPGAGCVIEIVEGKSRMKKTLELVRVKDDDIELKTTLEMHTSATEAVGGITVGPARELVPAMLTRDKLDEKYPPRQVGTPQPATIELAGRKLNCILTVREQPNGDIRRDWTSSAVPGGMVKSEVLASSTNGQVKATFTTLEFHLDK